jgi:hypothetical protein
VHGEGMLALEVDLDPDLDPVLVGGWKMDEKDLNATSVDRLVDSAIALLLLLVVPAPDLDLDLP